MTPGASEDCGTCHEADHLGPGPHIGVRVVEATLARSTPGELDSTSGAPTSGPDTLPLITCKNSRYVQELSFGSAAAWMMGAQGGTINIGPQRAP